MRENSAYLNIYLTFLAVLALVSVSRAQINVPPEIVATGDQFYCPLSQINIVTSFDIIDPDDSGIESLSIQITSGYETGTDLLTLTGNHPGIVSTWSATEGKLTLRGIGGVNATYTQLIAAVNDVVYSSSAPDVSGTKEFSYSLGDANYLPSTDHYYQFIDDEGITWTEARDLAEMFTYFGLQGYLATITTPEEAQLSGEQAPGTGWIGGSDAETEGVWKWMTGPEAGTVFWNGGVTGSSPNFAFWNTGEPNNLGDEDYAHVTAPGIGVPGSWNDLPNELFNPSDPYYPQGFIVEYGGMPGDPDVDISASTIVRIASVLETIPAERCGEGSLTIEATPSDGDIIWFDSITGDNQLGTGNTFTTPVLSNTVTYYALASVNGCTEGQRIPVNATIKYQPVIASSSGDIICNSGSGVLTAAADVGVVNWYDSAVGGNFLGTGNSFNTPAVSETTVFYAEAEFDDCTSVNRTAVTLTIQQTDPPDAISIQNFCDLDSATVADLVATGEDVAWYATETATEPLSITDLLLPGTYYATQTILGCESESRASVEVNIYQTVNPPDPSEIPLLRVCDNTLDGDDTNGVSVFDLTSYENILLNGAPENQFNIRFFTDPSYLNEIIAPEDFVNTVPGGQTIYVLFENQNDTSCQTGTQFDILVDELPEVQPVVLKNCDEDGLPDGLTDFNLSEAEEFLVPGNSSEFEFSFYGSLADAQNGIDSIDAFPYNNSAGNTIFVRVENQNSCFRISTIELQVSTTSFQDGYMQTLQSCDVDESNDGFTLFDLNSASQLFLDEFPAGQNLSVHYYRNLEDAQLEQNEINDTAAYINEEAFLQVLYVRVESQENGDCFGIGPHLTLVVDERPEFEVVQSDIFCLNGEPITLETSNPQGDYDYFWTDELGNVISTGSTATIDAGGTYTVTAVSDAGCLSDPLSFNVVESGIATISEADITVVDFSGDNSITITNTNLGFGDYEYALDDIDGPYQDEPVFTGVGAGDHVLYVRDKNGCGIASIEVFVLGFPKFFTPNNDGYNDSWNLKGWNSSFDLRSNIRIFDRYGKLLKDLSPSSEGWDGTFNGANLRASDYWFLAKLIKTDGTVRVVRGHFSLVR